MKPFKTALLVTLALAAPLLSDVCPAAWAAKRKIEFPNSGADRIINANVFPQKTTATEQRRRNAQREARAQVIAEIFAKYNRKLTQKQARDYAGYVLKAGDQFGQEPFVLAAMIIHESGANANAVSRGGDYGLMQVRWSVHKKKIMRKYPQVKKARDFLNPEINIMVGTEIFTEYREAVGGDLHKGLLRYSAGNKKLANRIFTTKNELEKAYQRRLKSK